MAYHEDNRLIDASSGYYAWCIQIMDDFTGGKISKLEMRAMSSKSFYLRHKKYHEQPHHGVGTHQREGGGSAKK